MIMKKGYSYSVIILISLALLFVSGCAKKSVLKEEALPKGAPAAAQKAGVDAAGKRAAEAPVEKQAAVEAKTAKQASLEPEVKKAAKAVPAKATFEFVDIYFDFDKTSLKDEARAVLDKDAEWLNKNKNVTVTAEGHCDERGTAEYNLALGERRAAAAAKYLVDLGVDAKRIKTISYGLERPADQRHNEEAWAKNRRVHIVPSGNK